MQKVQVLEQNKKITKIQHNTVMPLALQRKYNYFKRQMHSCL